MPPSAHERAFGLAYDELFARWPESTEERDVDTPYGPTRVHVHGPVDGPPLVLLPGGSATGLVWFANAPALGRRYRIHAVDLLGDAGRTERRGRPLENADDLTAWLDALLDGLGLTRAHLCGHSYGAWLAARYALRAPERVDRLALVDPTRVFAGFRPGYLLRALPVLVRPSEARARAFLAGRRRAPTRTRPGSASTPSPPSPPDASSSPADGPRSPACAHRSWCCSRSAAAPIAPPRSPTGSGARSRRPRWSCSPAPPTTPCRSPHRSGSTNGCSPSWADGTGRRTTRCHRAGPTRTPAGPRSAGSCPPSAPASRDRPPPPRPRPRSRP